MPRSPAARLAAVALLLTAWAPLRADEPPANPADLDRPIVELYKSGKLFDKREAKAVRAAFAERFEKVHADDLRGGFGEDYDTLTAWLNEHAEIKQELFNAIDEDHDHVAKVFAIFRDLWKHSPEQLAKYWNLAIATAVVWDDPQRGVYDYRGHQRRTKSILPDDYLKFTALDGYKYFLDHEKEIQGRESVNRIQALPWEFLVYVVNHRTPLAEREWALRTYLAHRALIGQVYRDIEYDKEMLRTRSESCKLNGLPYTLESIRKNGGVCAMQADFASRVAKCLGVPAVFVGGEAANLDLHAWVMWAEVKRLTPEKVEFGYLSYGQYPDLKHYTGDITNPQTGEKILDRDMERTLAVVGHDRAGKRQADLIMRAYPRLRESQSFDTPKRLSYIDRCLKVNPMNEAAWQELAGLARAGEFKGREQSLAALDHVETLLKTFRANPDFSWKVFDDLTSAQPDVQQRTRLYEKVVAMYEVGGRPDLACDARLRLADLQCEQKRFKPAATGLAFTIEKFPTEGRYVPKLMDKLQEVCKHFPEGTKLLVDFYLRVLPKIPPTRAGEVSKYCVEMHEQAIAFLKDNRESIPKDKKNTIIPALEGRLNQIKSGGRRS
jgi:hypothetical protein